MKVALIQNAPVFGEKEENLTRLLELIELEEADLYICPELCYVGYQFTSRAELASLADELGSSPVQRVAEAARKRGSAIVFGFAERAAEKIYNSALLVTPEGERHLYRKSHLFYKEKLFFNPGDTGFRVFSFRGVQLGVAICFDWIFPEAFRSLALQGADVIAHCANLVLPYCQRVDCARAIENRVFIFTANRVGSECRDGEELRFTGMSVGVSPRGEYVLQGNASDEEVLVTDIDPEVARNKRLNDYNDILSDRRPELYVDRLGQT